MTAPYRDWIALSDDHLAQKLAEHLAGHFLYHPLQRRWYCADPPHWRRDDTMLLVWRVRQYLRDLADQAEGVVGAQRGVLLSARKIKAVVSLLRSEPALVADPRVWRPAASGLVRQ